MKQPRSRADRLLDLARRVIEHENAIARLKQEMSTIVAEIDRAGEQEGPPDPRIRRRPSRLTHAHRVMDFFHIHPDRHVMIAAGDVVHGVSEFMKPEVATVVLSKLVAKGRLERVRHGHYRLPTGEPR